MCGIASFFGPDREFGQRFIDKAGNLLRHRGPDHQGGFNDGKIWLHHSRLSILDLSESANQPMVSSCGRYTIVFNGEVYNHLDLRKQYLPGYSFRTHSDTETILELFRTLGEKMLVELLGMWVMIIWDKATQRIFMSRDRFGQKPLYYRKLAGKGWCFASEMKPLIQDSEKLQCNDTAIAEYVSLGNYGHLGENSFFKDILLFPPSHYCWLSAEDNSLIFKEYWRLPEMSLRDRMPFDEQRKQQLHDIVVEAVLSQTLSDVPLGLTLSGGIDSSVIAGILAVHYPKDIQIFTGQVIGSSYDETKYVEAVMDKWKTPKFHLSSVDLHGIVVQKDLPKYLNIQEEPFGDPSIIAHGSLMQMAHNNGIKVVLGGQGADELFFGYNNMALAILPKQLMKLKLKTYIDNINIMSLGKQYFLRTILQALFPEVEHRMRSRSRNARRSRLAAGTISGIDDRTVRTYSYRDLNNVWKEAMYGVHLPHLVHYDDRNSMAYSIETRMPFLDHRLAEFIATIQPTEFLVNGKRKHILRESCREYLPDAVYDRTDKIGFHTPLADAIKRDRAWVGSKMASLPFVTTEFKHEMLCHVKDENLNTADALNVWRCLSVALWMELFNVG